MKLFVSLFLLSQSFLYAGWHDRKAEGWAWYEIKSTPIEQEAHHPVQQMQEAKRSLEEKLHLALFEPTSENVKAYMEEQKKWIERSSFFAHVWSQVLLNHPHLDYTAINPVSQYGLQHYKLQIQEQKEELIKSLVKDYGLAFFYEGSDPASSLFAQIVQLFTKKYGWETVAIAIDGIELEGFHHKKNDAITRALGVEITPALYLIDPKDNLFIPISFGLVAMDQIEENILLQFTENL